LLSGTQTDAYATYFYIKNIRQKIKIKQFSAKVGLFPNYAQNAKVCQLSSNIHFNKLFRSDGLCS